MNKKVRDDIILILIDRDGFVCQFPGCEEPFTEDNPPTLDHWMPVSIFGDNSIENFKLMHFVCNNKKGDAVPNADGTIILPRRPPKMPKCARPKLCEACTSGRVLRYGEICPVCGLGPQPKPFPTAYKRKPKNCSHAGKDHCPFCVMGIVKRRD